MNQIKNNDVAAVFQSYPANIKEKLLLLRQLILDTKGIAEITETLKWGEPSCLAKGGSTVRLGWKK